MLVYVVLYIHTDKPDYTEVLGVYDNKHSAVVELLNRANYREKEGQLTQYMIPTDEYSSYNELKTKVYNDMELVDCDIYRIIEEQVQTQ